MSEKDTLDVFGMDDAEFAKLSAADLEAASAASGTSDDLTPADDTTTTDDDEPVAKTAAELAAEKEGEDDASGDDPSPSGSDPDPADDAAKKAAEDKDKDEDNPLDKPDGEEGDSPKPKSKADEPKPADKAVPAKPAEVDPKATPKAEAEPKKVDAAPAPSSKDQSPEQLASFFDKVMAPLKANGREITLRTPEEAIRLMQMGAGYGKKLQDLQPSLKSLRMLEKNNLLDENKLSFLIDLNNKNPAAIKKLIKDSGIDPLDINLEDNADYKPTNHSVTDNEVAFQDTLKEVAAAPGGKETIRHINTDWDKESKDLLWNDPQIMTIIQAQRETGVYGVITAEIDRQKMLGDIPANTPFLKAYKIAGDALVKAQGIPTNGSEPKDDPKPKPSTTPAQEKLDQAAAKVLGTRTAAPKSAAANNDKARAAASPKASAKPAKVVVNPLDMADDDFLREFKL